MPNMEVKEKKCKGTGKAIGYGCGKLTLWRRYGLCQRCFADWLYNSAAGKESLLKLTIRAKKKTEKQRKKELRAEKEKNKSIAALIQEARIPFQQFIKIRDANRKCISCGRDSETWNAGHFYKAELYSGLIFDEDNCHRQCVYCNLYLDGNENGYRQGLIKRYGESYVSKLDQKAVIKKDYKYTRDQLIQIKKYYKAEIKKLLS